MFRYNPQAAFQADCVRNAEQVILRFSGRLMVDPEAGPPGWQACFDRVSVPAVSLDLGDVTAIDATGLGLLAEVVRTARSQGRRLELLAASPRVRTILSLTRLDTLVGGGAGHGCSREPKIAA